MFTTFITYFLFTVKAKKYIFVFKQILVLFSTYLLLADPAFYSLLDSILCFPQEFMSGTINRLVNLTQVPELNTHVFPSTEAIVDSTNRCARLKLQDMAKHFFDREFFFFFHEEPSSQVFRIEETVRNDYFLQHVDKFKPCLDQIISMKKIDSLFK